MILTVAYNQYSARGQSAAGEVEKSTVAFYAPFDRWWGGAMTVERIQVKSRKLLLPARDVDFLLTQIHGNIDDRVQGGRVEMDGRQFALRPSALMMINGYLVSGQYR